MQQTRIPLWSLILGLLFAIPVDAANTIRKKDFNFGHQLGYLYVRMNDAYFDPHLTFRFETGFTAYHTDDMPRVASTSPWNKYTLYQVPGLLRFTVLDIVEIQFNTDAVLQTPMHDIHSLGGNSPRFKTKILLMREKNARPQLAFTFGVKFSSAKPWTIWADNHNYIDSNGLSGPGTGVADYLLLLHMSKQLVPGHYLHFNAGLAPLGSPVEYTRGSGQADEIPLRLGWEGLWNDRYGLRLEVAGMVGALSTTNLDTYMVVRLEPEIRWNNQYLFLTTARGLTNTTDTWTAGFRYGVRFDLASRRTDKNGK